uniref:RNA-directed DNA polymerase, eukaryota n=1 Tax=Tanacetum cinerariifolium TaxID=118510 RepID=A0A699ID03_TANCI|nr:RNA-directed DNA polymerase, eukaryota [Tanacetum cinerariifolium]
MHENDHEYNHASKCTEHPINSDDPFEIYKILGLRGFRVMYTRITTRSLVETLFYKINGKSGLEKNKDNVVSESIDPQFPPGFTPDDGQKNVDEVKSARDSQPKEDLIGTNVDVASVTSGIKGFTTLKLGGSLLDVIDELIKVGHAMGYYMMDELHDLNSNASLDMIQKVKIRYAIEGDENSKYFHGIINNKRFQLAICMVLIEGDLIVEPSHLFDIERDVTYDEIKKAVWDCRTNKSLCPDGFTFEFFRRYWKIFDDDVVAAVLQFFSSCTFSPRCNSSFTALIPKTQEAKGIPINDSLILSHLFYVDDVVFVAESIGCSILTAPFNFIGVKVGDIMSRHSSWEETISKLSFGLSKWKLKALSIGGCLTLIKSVLSSLPLYHMSIFKCPMGVLKLLESIRRNFFNGVANSDKKLTLIGWKNIWLPRQMKGLVSQVFMLLTALFFSNGYDVSSPMIPPYGLDL